MSFIQRPTRAGVVQRRDHQIKIYALTPARGPSKRERVLYVHALHEQEHQASEHRASCQTYAGTAY